MSLTPYIGVWIAEDPQEPARRTALTVLPDGERVWIELAVWSAPGAAAARLRLGAPLDGASAPVPGSADLRAAAEVDAEGLVLRLVDAEGAEVATVLHRRDGDALVREEHARVAEAPESSTLRLSAARVKQVICYRRDLTMRKGKIAAQCAHAALAVFLRRDRGAADQLGIPLEGPMALWAKHRSAKIVLSVESEEDLLAVHRLAEADGLPTALITDAGRTEFGGVPTRTAVAVGPAPAAWIDRITGRDGRVPTRLA